MSESNEIGIVVGVERLASNPLDFWLYVQDNNNVQLDDIVHLEITEEGEDEPRFIYGIIDEMKKSLEGTDFASDAELYPNKLPANLAEIAHVSVLRVQPQIFNPPSPGLTVYKATENKFKEALYEDVMDRTFVLGHTRTGLSQEEVIYGNLDFLDGESGAHVNISGISGVATKTSYATFLLHSIFSSLEMNKKANTHAIIFNVKGEDLMWLDKTNSKIDKESQNMYKKMGIKPNPFSKIQFYSKPDGQNSKIPASRTGENAKLLHWTIEDFCKEQYIRLLFTEDDFRTTQIESLVNLVASKLEKEFSKGDNSIDACSTIYELIEEIDDLTNPGIDTQEQKGKKGTVAGKWVQDTNMNEATWAAFMRRLKNSARYINDMISDDSEIGSGVHYKKTNVTVVDIHQLHGRAQKFVVGVILKELIADKEKTDAGGENSPVFIVLDELNKYAPKDNSSQIKEYLVDIAERGRSMNIILIGAQQTASEIEPRIVSNSAFRVTGRLDAAESEKSEYGYLTQAAKTRTKLLQPGTMVVTQPQVPIPILLQFPFPAWATKKSDVANKGTKKMLKEFASDD
ncbi:MAG: ATP-binding protein [Dehalococcoidia bacterium]